jgi:3-hydroxybutyryl-CoA dehydrogenase
MPSIQADERAETRPLNLLLAYDVLVIGAGLMGAGIAQVAAQSGHRVFLFDQRDGAAAEARAQIGNVLSRQVAKGKLAQDVVDSSLERLIPITTLADGVTARIAIEAIVEQLEAKKALMRELELLLSPVAILATNTSSISVTAIAAELRRPEQVVGMHFFNPVPLMALVEVVSGLQTATDVSAEVERIARAWGKVPVHARSTPGFIVNRIARPFYGETLMLLQEGAARPEVLDAALRSAGFRMGPCELMDLIGHDTNFAVTKSVFEANFFDRRFTPSLVQRELVDAGLLGRKSGRGFYSYPSGAPTLQKNQHWVPDLAPGIEIHGFGHSADLLAERAATLAGVRVSCVPTSTWTGLQIGKAQLRLTDGRPAWMLARDLCLQDVAVFDELPVLANGVVSYAAHGSDRWRMQVPGWLQVLGWLPVELGDLPGLVVARTLSMLVNETADAVQQAVCTPDGADAAMKLGMNYPSGPFEWLERMGAERVTALIEALDANYRGERYRVSSWLRSRC